MLNLEQILSQELSLRPVQIQKALELFAEGATVPFIARYRKERTGEMNEIQLRDLQDRYLYLTELRDRQTVILQAIADQGKLTDALKAKIEACLQKTELEDLYLPYRPKRRTRAAIAKEDPQRDLALLPMVIDLVSDKPTDDGPTMHYTTPCTPKSIHSTHKPTSTSDHTVLRL
jgi:uncharacterized protein